MLQKSIKIEPMDAVVKQEPVVKSEPVTEIRIPLKEEFLPLPNDSDDFDISLSEADLHFEEQLEEDHLIISTLEHFALPKDLTGPTFENLLIAIFGMFFSND